MRLPLLATLLALASCTRAGPNVVQAKVFALTPDEYIGKRIHVKGLISEAGPGHAFFSLTDDTGSVLATTENLGSPLPCGPSDSVLAEGVVKSGGDSGRAYISILKVIECHKASDGAKRP